ncbi:MAG: sigma-70 family RNA polymerase sigma factor [Calditrichae bacterium]|nr:sigma-70 family RNA polymerase sigma factor [Calditrichia bacterium]
MLKFSNSLDREFIQRIKANDRTVLGELFMKYQRMISVYVLKNGGDKNDAEDIIQETIIVLWQKVNSDSLQLTVKLGTYLLAIAKNKWMAELRKRRKISPQDISENISNGNPSSLDNLVNEEKIEYVRKALEMLQPICKKLLLLYYFEEKNMKEIAKILNLANADVAKSKKYQCKKNLEEILQENINEFAGGN